MRPIILAFLLSSTITINSESINSILKGRSINSVREILKCASSYDYACILDYVEDGVDKAYSNLMREADANARRSLNEVGRKKEEEESPSSIITTITSMLSELPELLRASLTAALSGEESDEKTADGADEDDNENAGSNDDDDEEEEEAETDDEEETDADENDNIKDNAESKAAAVNKNCKNNTSCSKSITAIKTKHVGVSRKKKLKKKVQKLKAIIKIAIAAIVIVVKITLLLKLLAAKLQLKFFLIALVNLLINVARFWWDLKKGHHPQKVIYYEHAQHQHHYDGGEDFHSSGGSGPGDSYWGRAYEKLDDKKAQDLAYSKQAPGGTTYSRVNDKPNFSWNPWAERSL